MIPVIAIVGRPNVGKSTLFNCLTKSRDALVASIAGVTRDRQYGEGSLDERRFIVIDTGGIGEQQQGDIPHLIEKQAQQALQEADIILFVVDGRAGLTAADEELTKQLRILAKPIQVVVNKTDGLDPDTALAEFHAIGLGTPFPIAAAHRRGVTQLLHNILEPFQPPLNPEEQAETGIKIAVIGRPNVGKSTLVNRMLGEERMIVFDSPGTTHDSIFIPFERQGKPYTLIDTAGVRRRARITDIVEKFSVVKTLQAIEACNVVIFVMNAREGISDQDLHLLGFVVEAGKALVLAVNKWDGLEEEDRNQIRSQIDRRLQFVDFAKMYFISALHGSGVGVLFKAVEEAYNSSMQSFTTAQLTKILEKAIFSHNPPLVKSRRIKLRYAHPGGHNPPTIVIHGNQLESLPQTYQRYLINYFREQLKLVGTPIRLSLRTNFNPYTQDKD